MLSRLKIYAIIHSLILLILLSLLIVSLFTCGEDEVINPERIKTAPARLEIMMSPKASIAEITSVRLIVTGDDIDSPIEVYLSIDRNLGKATGSVNVPIGDNRVFQVEVYAGKSLRYIGQQKIDVRSATSVRIPVGIKPAEGIGVIAISEHTRSNGLAIAIGDVDIFLSEYAGNRRFVQNLARSLGNAPRLKIDLTRGTAFSSQILQGIETALRNGGFQVQMDESFAYDRSRYDAILFALPNKSFDISQINVIQQFVQNGGMLLLIADSGENLEPINNVANVFGLNFEYSIVSLAGGNPASVVLRNFASLPLFDEVLEINASYARSISTKPDLSSELKVYNGATPGPNAVVSSDEPKLFISPTEANLGEILQSASFDIGNAGTGTLSWNIVKDSPLPNWLSITPESGKASAGEKRNVTARVNRSGLDPGEYRYTVQVNSNAGEGKFLIIMRVPEPDPVLSFSPSSLNFGTTDTQRTLTITNSGGKTLDWQASKGQSWVNISPSIGSLASGKSQTITITINRTGLAPGNYSDTISISSNGGSGNVSVSMSVPEPSPSLSISPTSLDFGATNTQMTFNITNSGGGTLNWQASKQQLWLNILPTTGSLTAGKSQTVTLTVNRADLKEGVYRDVVSITTNVGSGNVNVSMTVPEPSPSLSFNPTSIDFGTADTTKTLTITNKGGGTLNWQVSKAQNWLTLSPTSGTLTSGNSQNITLTVVRTNINPGSYKDTVSITSNGGNGSVSIIMTVPEPSPSLSFNPTSIDFGITDTTKTLTITNKGGGTLNWQATNQQSWLTISPKNGSLSAGVSQTVTLTVTRESTLAVVPQPGTYKDTINITSNGGNGTVNVTMIIPEQPPALSVSTTAIVFGTVDTQKELIISNNGGRTLSWQLSKTQAWLTVNPTNGLITSGKTQTVTISVSRSGLSPGDYKDTIDVTSNGGTAIVNVVMTVSPVTPVLAFSPSALDFGTTETQKTLTITNNGAGTLSWFALRQQPWLTLSTSVGALDAGKSVNITVTVSRLRLNPGSYKDTISITSNGGNSSVPVTMTVPEPDPLLSLSTKTLDFGSDTTQLTFNITNNGGGTLSWRASKNQSWLSLSALSGSLNAGASATITAKADRSVIKPGTHTDTISITSNGGNGNISVNLLMPGLSYSPSSLEFGLNETQKTFTIKNVGAGILAWKASKKADWLTLSSTSGTLGANASTTITVTVSRDVSAGANTDTIILTSNGGDGKIEVSMPIPGLSFSPASFDFGTTDTTKTLKISNIGGGILNWKIDKRQAWITLNPSSGSTAGGASTDVQVTVSRANLLPGTFSDILVITSDGGSGSVPVNIAVAGFLVSPTSLDFGSIDTQKTLTITNNGGGPVTWQASKKEAWLTVSPDKGTVDAGRSIIVNVTISRTGIKPGSYSDTIIMTSNAGDRSVKVNMDVAGLSFTPTAINFGSTDTRVNLSITNTGSGSLSWSLSKTKSWLTLSQTSGFNQAGETKVITVTSTRENVSPGTNNDTITITSNAGNATIPVTLLVPGLGLSPTTLDFGSSDTQKTFTISNTGAGSLVWQGTKSQPWLSFTPTSGTVSAGQSTNVTVNVSRTDLDPGDYSDIIQITYNGGTGSVTVKMGIPKLSFTPTSLDFGTSVNQMTFKVSNSGGGTLTWQATNKMEWLTITPVSGSLSAGQSSNVTATINRASLKPGIYADTINLSSNGGNGNIAVQVLVPGLSFNPTSLSFSGTETTKNLTITNSGGGTLTWQASKTQAWLSLSLTSGSLDAGKSAVITVTVTRDNLNPGTYQDTISIKTNGGNGEVPVTMIVLSPSMTITPTSLSFGSTATQRSFTITNTGGGTLSWIIVSTLPSWLSASPMSGSLTAGNSATVTVVVNRSGMNPGDYTATINVNSNAGAGQSVSVTMTVPRPSLSLSPTKLDFGTSETIKEFRITNTGGGTLLWTASTNRDWLLISRDPEREGWNFEINNGSTGPYGSTRVYVRVIRKGNPGTYNGIIEVRSNGSPVANGNVEVSMVIPIPEIR